MVVMSTGDECKDFLPERGENGAEGCSKKADKHDRSHPALSPSVKISDRFLHLFKSGVDTFYHARDIIKRPVGFLLLFILLFTILPRFLLI